MKATTATRAYRWGQVFLLAAELIVVVLLVSGGCYSKQNYQVLATQTGDERLNRCNVIVEGHVLSVEYRRLKGWQQYVFCWPLGGEDPSGPARYDLSIEIDKVLKGDQNMPRMLQLNNCRPLRPEESALIPQVYETFIENTQLRIGYNRQDGNSYRNLIVVPLGRVPTTKSTTLIPSAPAGH